MADGGIQPYKGRDASAIIERVLSLYEEDGLEVTQSAPIVDVPARTIHRWLATNASDRWKEVQQARALSDYEQARTARANASTVLSTLQQTLADEDVNEGAERNWRLAHAREVLKAADTQLDHQKWLLERLLAKLYGKQPEVSINIGVSLDQALTGRASDLLGRIAGSVPRLLDVKPTEAELASHDD